MVFLLWDASALAKRYAPEVGSDTVDALFAADERFVRTAQAEGLRAVNPEVLPAADVPALLVSL